MMALNPKRCIGPEVFTVRELLCSSHTGKGTGLECSECIRSLAEERDTLRTRVAELEAEKSLVRGRETKMARMCVGLIDLYAEVLPDELTPDVEEFLLSIEGKEVRLVFIGPDAFEISNDNFWLPNLLWNEVKPMIAETGGEKG